MRDDLHADWTQATLAAVAGRTHNRHPVPQQWHVCDHRAASRRHTAKPAVLVHASFSSTHTWAHSGPRGILDLYLSTEADIPLAWSIPGPPGGVCFSGLGPGDCCWGRGESWAQPMGPLRSAGGEGWRHPGPGAVIACFCGNGTRSAVAPLFLNFSTFA